MSEDLSFLVYGGKTGWIGQQIVELLRAQGHTVYSSQTRLEDRAALDREIDALKPTFLVNCAGVTGRPNVDWCEEHKPETIRANVVGTLNVCDLAFLRGLHLTNFATGCIYEYNAEKPMHGDAGFAEDDPPNFEGSFYSMTKGMVEKLARVYPNVLTLRVRMPLADDLHPRNFITKITKYEKVVNVPNSMTVLHDLLPVAIDMTVRRRTGVYNFTNPGAITHNEVLALYKKHIDPQFTWTNFTLEEQSRILKAGRSNNRLDVSKLLQEYPQIKPIHEAAELLFQRMAAKIKADGVNTGGH